ncbi:hypothetical protein Btru_024689 [Bulinus truncatus]|nr:hypothetical protein Btru_024689 [Bulinus truncatus]
MAHPQIKLVNISSNDIVDGNPKLTLGLVWSIILHWQVKDVMKNVMEDLGQTNLERTLLSWCQLSTQGYEQVDIVNFTTSWRDGLAFNALIHHYRPDLFNYKHLLGKDNLHRLNHAFSVANDRLGIDKLLDAEDTLRLATDTLRLATDTLRLATDILRLATDTLRLATDILRLATDTDRLAMVMYMLYIPTACLMEFLLLSSADMNVDIPDKKSVMTYLMCMFQVLPHSIVSSRGINNNNNGGVSDMVLSPSSSKRFTAEVDIGQVRDKGMDNSECLPVGCFCVVFNASPVDHVGSICPCPALYLLTYAGDAFCAVLTCEMVGSMGWGKWRVGYWVRSLVWAQLGSKGTQQWSGAH